MLDMMVASVRVDMGEAASFRNSDARCGVIGFFPSGMCALLREGGGVSALAFLLLCGVGQGWSGRGLRYL